MIDTAILLAAGEGSRLRAAAPYKPLCQVAGRTLIDHALTGLAEAGITRAVVVLGYGGDAVAAHLAAHLQPLTLTITRSDHRRPNGVSALAGSAEVAGDALLAMCDHLVDPALYARLSEAGAGDGLRLGVDRRLRHPWVDPLDVTCVATEGDRITAIGKGNVPHDCYDTGVFAVGPALFAALATLADPSLTDGVRALAIEGRAQAIDCSDLDWIDVDDAAALAKAEAWLSPPAPMRASGRT